MKNIIFNKDSKQDLMKDHLMYETLNYRIFSADENIETGAGKIVTASGDLFEGQFLNKQPNGFGRLIYVNSTKQTKCYVGFFENGIPVGKVKKFIMVKSTGKILLENQGIAKLTEGPLDNIEIAEEKITSFGGNIVKKDKIKLKKT